LTSKSGLKAKISTKSIGKMVSSAAATKSFDAGAHFQAAANIDKIFTNAIEPWQFELNPVKNNDGLKARKYLYAPMEYDGRVIPIKITVKEYIEPTLENKLYSIEAIDASI
jgi:hypothetical protein